MFPAIVNKLNRPLLLALLLAAGSALSQAQPAPTLISGSGGSAGQNLHLQLPDFSALVDREGPAVVNISSTETVKVQGAPFPDMSPDDPFYQFFRRFGRPSAGPREYHSQSLGSGFIISPDGYILTNRHVVNNASEVKVTLTDKREFKAKVIGMDQRTDVALIKIEAQALPTVNIGDSSKLKVGQWVVAIGAPFGFENSVTQGIISAKGRALPDENYVPFIQTDVPINPGNSGGPLFDLTGTVVGINSQIYSRTGGYMGLSFAIPIDVAMNVVNQIRAHGKVIRGMIGVEIQGLTPGLAASFGLKGTDGALVAGVVPGSPADKAGVKMGDVIMGYDGKTVGEATELPRLVADTKPGTAVELQVWRKGAERQLRVVAGELEPEKVAGSAAASTGGKLGLAVEDLSPDQKRQLGVNHGVVVEGVQGKAALAGIRPGDVILALNNNKVTNIEELKKLLARNPADKSIALLIRRDDNSFYVPLRPQG